MESVKVNLTEVPSCKTWSDRKEPQTAIDFQDKLNRLGDKIVGIVYNKKNSAYCKEFFGTPKEVHQQVYQEKLEVGATEPNSYTRGDIPKKGTNKFIKNPRKQANTDYEVTFMSDLKDTITINSSYDLDTFTLTFTDESQINYIYNEDKLLKELKDYIDGTYNQHYAKDKFQATEFIIDGGHGTGFCIGNVLKYAQRYGKKGSHDDARKDLMKVLHYALIQLYIHDQEA